MIIISAAVAATLMPAAPAGSVPGLPGKQQTEMPLPGYRDPAVRFAPMGVKVAFRVSAGRIMSDCRVELFGDPDPHWRDNPCRNIARPDFLDLIGVDSGLDGRMTALLTLSANGRSVEPGTMAGRLTFRTAARFALGADGSVAACRPEAQLGNGDRLDLCPAAFPRRSNPFEPGAGQREGLLTLEFYLER